MADPLAAAVQALARGGLVVYPTDTLYGLAARTGDVGAVDGLIRVKQRPKGLPISVLVSSTEEVEAFAELSENARRFLRRTLPGPYTLIVRARAGGSIAPALLNTDGSIGIRIPDHPLARELARRSGPITATSANRHGVPPGGSVREIRRALGAQVDEYIAVGPAPSGRPSMLIDLTGDRPRPILRSPRGGRP